MFSQYFGQYSRCMKIEIGNLTYKGYGAYPVAGTIGVCMKSKCINNDSKL